MSSIFLQILGLKPQISRSIEQFFLTVGQNNFGNKTFLLFSNQKRFPKLPGFVGKCCQIFGIFSLLIPKAYLMSLIVGNDNCTLAFGGLYMLEFIVMISFNKIFWSSFGSKHINFTLGCPGLWQIMINS